ncbi:hypothetical protein XFPR_12485 [Xylella fastidiosa]|uniref:Uncharacterized protein n=1 Tax=Xylella fastidiosa (strain 9a5c) TaxID=160492 RepID=Q9PB59_XYLFA|nr:hypothetical protein XF_2285 [Xylella fastidiosa 9a5c]QPB72995.1 hypothetical protein XFPR_12485 [Xylella fastidiosa]
MMTLKYILMSWSQTASAVVYPFYEIPLALLVFHEWAALLNSLQVIFLPGMFDIRCGFIHLFDCQSSLSIIPGLKTRSGHTTI